MSMDHRPYHLLGLDNTLHEGDQPALKARDDGADGAVLWRINVVDPNRVDIADTHHTRSLHPDRRVDHSIYRFLVSAMSQ